MFERVMVLRLGIAKLGEQDACGWWASSALSEQGRFVLGRIFRRAPEFGAAHVAILAARAAHEAALPREPLIHLFNLGETFEGAFERWLMRAKAEGGQMPAAPKPVLTGDDGVARYLMGLGLGLSTPRDGSGTVALGETTLAALEREGARLRAAQQLAAAYAHSRPQTFRPPYLRLRA